MPTKPRPAIKINVQAATADTLADELRDYDARMKADAASRWRAWAERVADGGELPTPRELLEAASTLGITDPGRCLHADAQAVSEHRNYMRTAASCREVAAEKLEPYGGRMDRLQADIDATAEKLQSLRTLYDEVSGGCCEPFWISAADRVAAEHPRALTPSWGKKK